MSDLGDFFKAMSSAKKEVEEQKAATPAGKAIKGLQERLRQNNDIGELMEVFVEKKPVVKEVIKEVVVHKEVVKEQESFQQPKPPEVDPNVVAIQQKLKFLEQAIGKIAATGPGSGEVNLRWLDDVDRSTIENNRYLRYHAATKKFIFDDVDSVGEYLTLWDTTTQPVVASSVPQVVTYNQTNGSRNISVADSTKITVTKDGTYNIIYSFQIVNTGNEQEDISIWIKCNGTNVADTNSSFTVPAKKSTGISGKIIASSPVPVDLLAGDYVEIYLHCVSTNVSITTIDAYDGMPRTPSVIVTVQKL